MEVARRLHGHCREHCATVRVDRVEVHRDLGGDHLGVHGDCADETPWKRTTKRVCALLSLLFAAMYVAQEPVFRDTPHAKPAVSQNSSHKHRSKHPVSARLLEDLWGKTHVFVAGAWVLALLKANKKFFFLFKE